jgi:hypothetical protein
LNGQPQLRPQSAVLRCCLAAVESTSSRNGNGG